MSQVKNIKIGNTSYGITDANTLPALTSTQRTQLLTNGTYLGSVVPTNKVFETEEGKFEKFTDTITGMTLSWADSTLPTLTGGDVYSAVAYGNGVFIAVGAAYYSKTSSTFARSTDGSTWTSVSAPSTNYWRDVAYGNGAFVVLGNGIVTRSTDGGLTWTTTSIGSYLGKKIYFINNLFVVSGETNYCYYSSDGATWSRGGYMYFGTSSSHFYLPSTGKYYFSVGKLYSLTDLSLGGYSVTEELQDFVYSYCWATNGSNVAVLSSRETSNKTYVFKNNTWTAVNVGMQNKATNVTYTDGKFYIFEGDTTNAYMSSDNGSTWITVTGLSIPQLYSVKSVYVNGKIYMPNMSASYKMYEGTETASHAYALSDAGPYIPNTATGANAIAIKGTATGTRGIAIGLNSTASANNSVAMGYNATASTSGGVAIGYYTSSVGPSCFALGFYSTAGRASSGSTTIAGYSTAVGYSSSATGNYTTAIGCSSTADGMNAVAIGYNAVASAPNAIQIGTGTNTTTDSLQFRGYQVLNSSGVMPIERLGGNSSAASPTKFLREDGTWQTVGGGGSATYDATTQEITFG